MAFSNLDQHMVLWLEYEGDALAGGVGGAELVVDAERAGESFADVGCAEGGWEGEKGR